VKSGTVFDQWIMYGLNTVERCLVYTTPHSCKFTDGYLVTCALANS